MRNVYRSLQKMDIKTKKIKSIFSIIFCLMITGLFLSGCGGGGDDSAPATTTPPPVTAPTSHTPVISNLQYSPQTATQNQGNGTVTIIGAINFTDQGGDVKTAVVNRYNAQGVLLGTGTGPLSNLSGVTSGSTTAAGDISTANVGVFTIEVYVIDAAGNSSNKLTGTFTVTAPADPLYAKTLLLRGKWHFAFTILTSPFAYDYSLSTISNTKNNQGGYTINGTDQYGDPVVADYWPNDGLWTLTDPSIGINRFYAFYTDGTTILGNSCYYQISQSTGTWSSCFSLSGSKTSPTPDDIFDRQEDSMIEQMDQEELLLENTISASIDDDTKDKYYNSKNAIDQGSASPK